MARKGRSRKVTRRRKLKGGVHESNHYETLVNRYNALGLENVLRNRKYNAYKMNDEGEVQDLGGVTITGNGRGAGAYDTINFKDDDDNTYTSDYNEDINYMTKDGYFFTVFKSEEDPGSTEGEEDPTGGRRKRKLKRSTRRKHL